MTPTLLLTESTHLLKTSTGAYELPKAANDEFPQEITDTLGEFNARITGLTSLTVVESWVATYKSKLTQILGISQLWSITKEEETTLKLAIFFWTADKVVETMLRDRKEQKAANDNYIAQEQILAA